MAFLAGPLARQGAAVLVVEQSEEGRRRGQRGQELMFGLFVADADWTAWTLAV
jgi:hypothetical protein